MLAVGFICTSIGLTILAGRVVYERAAPTPDAAGSGWAVEIDSQTFKSTTYSLGLQASYAASQSWGVLLPYAGLEWVHEFQDNDDAVNGRFVQDTSATGFVLPVDGTDSNYFNLELGVSAQFTGGTSGFLSYRSLLGYDDLDHYSINAGLRFEF